MKVSLFEAKTYITVTSQGELKEETYNGIWRALRQVFSCLFKNSHLRAAANKATQILLSEYKEGVDPQADLAMKVMWIVQVKERLDLNPNHITVERNIASNSHHIDSFDCDNYRLINRARNGQLTADRLVENGSEPGRVTEDDLGEKITKTVAFHNLYHAGD